MLQMSQIKSSTCFAGQKQFSEEKTRKKKKYYLDLHYLDLQLTCYKYYTKEDKSLLILNKWFSLTHWF